MANSSEGKVVALYTSAWIEITCSRKPFSEYTVALYTSAWIEINLFDPKDQIITVALYTSAWIEMKRPSFQEMVAYVALYTSAWIEMSITCMYSSSIGSHSTRVRGLKFREIETAVRCFSRTLHECVD